MVTTIIQGYIFNIWKFPLQNCMDCKHCISFGDYSSTVFYPFSNKWGILKAYTFKIFVFLKHSEKNYNFHIYISTWSPSAPCSRGFKWSWSDLGSSKAEPWLVDCSKSGFMSHCHRFQNGQERAQPSQKSRMEKVLWCVRMNQKGSPKTLRGLEAQTLLMVWELKMAERTCYGLHPSPS